MSPYTRRAWALKGSTALQDPPVLQVAPAQPVLLVRWELDPLVPQVAPALLDPSGRGPPDPPGLQDPSEQDRQDPLGQLDLSARQALQDRSAAQDPLARQGSTG